MFVNQSEVNCKVYSVKITVNLTLSEKVAQFLFDICKTLLLLQSDFLPNKIEKKIVQHGRVNQYGD